MAPVDMPPVRAVGILLIEEVILASPMDETVRLVGPCTRRQRVVDGALRIVRAPWAVDLQIGLTGGS